MPHNNTQKNPLAPRPIAQPSLSHPAAAPPKKRVLPPQTYHYYPMYAELIHRSAILDPDTLS